jgi:hypothetical protein
MGETSRSESLDFQSPGKNQKIVRVQGDLDLVCHDRLQQFLKTIVLRKECRPDELRLQMKDSLIMVRDKVDATILGFKGETLGD